MTTTVTQLPLTDTPWTIMPDLVVGYSATYSTGNFIHDVIGSIAPVVTTNGSRLRKGTMTFLFTTEDGASDAVFFLRQSAAFQFSTTDLLNADMNFVISGDITITLDPESLTAWLVVFDFAEIAL